jgi:hypothetical protein
MYTPARAERDFALCIKNRFGGKSGEEPLDFSGRAD